MKLSVGFFTGRVQSEISWLLSSLIRQMRPDDEIQLVVVDFFKEQRANFLPPLIGHGTNVLEILHVDVMPNVWQGKHRLTKDSWWAASSSRNTFLCLAKHPFIAGVDDRSVLAPTWLDAVREAQQNNYAVCGAYEKRVNMVVENGVITSPGETIGLDHRLKSSPAKPIACLGQWFYTGTFALPLEWALKVNGFLALLDGLGAEDTHFGQMLANNGLPIVYDPRLFIIEDRTPEFIGQPFRKESKQRFNNDPEDKGHNAIRKFYHLKMSPNPYDIIQLRESVQSGEPFPPPSGFTHDWHDGQPIAAM